MLLGENIMTNTQSLPINRKKWAVDELDRLTELGAFADENIELIEGDLSEKMSHNEPYGRGVLLMQHKLIQIFGQGHVVRSQAPLLLENSKPEPDVAVVRGNCVIL